jgi:NADH-quinone oxidoreductase subunit E
LVKTSHSGEAERQAGHGRKEASVMQAAMNGEIGDLIARHSGHQGALIPLLQEVQERHGYVRARHMEEIARNLKMTAAQVYGVATFYSQFRLIPPGKTVVKVCRGTACHVRGSARVLQQLEDTLDCRSGSTSEDFRYSLEEIACFGACSLAPVVVVGEEVQGRLTPEKARKLIIQREMRQFMETKDQSVGEDQVEVGELPTPVAGSSERG